MEMPDKQLLWDSVLAELQLSLSGAIFQTWFKGKTSVLSVENGVIEIGCSNSYNKVWLEERYLGQIKKIVDRVTGKSNALLFTVSSQMPTRPVKTRRAKPSNTTPLFEAEAEPQLKENLATANINQKYSFSSFIVGSSNQLAYAVSKAVVDSPRDHYNPLLIYGGVGVGKTHLLQAIGQAVVLRRSGVRALYCSSETFTNDMVDSIQKKQTFGFREKYRNLDLLLVDDTQFLAGRESTQEQFFHTFNHLVLQGKQVVLSCDRNPKELSNLQGRLKSRFSGGMVAPIDPPDLELREAVLLAKARSEGVSIDFGVISSLAKTLGPSIRDVEGGLLRLLAVSKLTGKRIDEALVEKTIGKNPKRETDPNTVLNETARYFSLPVEDLRGVKRGKNNVLPRQVAMYILRGRLRLSFKAVASYFGGKDHSTVIYSVGRVEKMLKTNPEIARAVEELIRKLFGA